MFSLSEGPWNGKISSSGKYGKAEKCNSVYLVYITVLLSLKQ